MINARYRKLLYGFLGLLILITLVAVVIIYQARTSTQTTIRFLDIGQGDAILISEGQYQILIDGGPDGRRLEELLGRSMPFWDRTLDVVIATHPDRDHIDGLVNALEKYHVDTFWHSGLQKATDVSVALERVIAHNKNITPHTPLLGDRITLPSGAELTIVHPTAPFEGTINDDVDANALSIAAVLHVGDEWFYFGGDLPYQQEEQLSLPHTPLTVLKAGHHGSKTSTSQAFLDKTNPRDVIISAGKDNRYGHPHRDVVQRVLKHGARLFSTIESGTIVYTCPYHGACVISFDP